MDPSDAEAVYFFSKTNDGGKNCIADDTGISVRSKIYVSPFYSPTTRSGGASHGKNQGTELNKISENNCTFETNNNTQFSGLQVKYDHSDPEKCQPDEPDFGFATPMDEFDNDDDDPWKPLNPHELGNLKVKPFKRSEVSRFISLIYIYIYLYIYIHWLHNIFFMHYLNSQEVWKTCYSLYQTKHTGISVSYC